MVRRRENVKFIEIYLIHHLGKQSDHNISNIFPKRRQTTGSIFTVMRIRIREEGGGGKEEDSEEVSDLPSRQTGISSLGHLDVRPYQPSVGRSSSALPLAPGINGSRGGVGQDIDIGGKGRGACRSNMSRWE